MHTIIAITAYLALTTATPTGPSSGSSKCSKETPQLATFDDLVGIPGTATNPIPMGYKGLYFQGFQFSDVIQTNLLPGPVPHSSPNFAVSDSVSTTMAGSAEITTNFQGSLVKAYTPKSFYYGCALNLLNGASDPAVDCDITATGFRKGDVTGEAVQVASQHFSYDSTTMLGVQQLAFGAFNSQFQNVQYILFQYTNEGGLATANGALSFLIDDFQFSTCA